MSVSLASIDPKKRKQIENVEREVIEQAIQNEKKYQDKVKMQRYKETCGLEDIQPPPKSNIDEKKNFSYQIQLLFQNLIEFFSVEGTLREYINKYVQDIEKAEFINNNIDRLKKRLEGMSFISPSYFDRFVSDMKREEEGLTGIYKRDMNKRFSKVKEEIMKTKQYTLDEDIGELMSILEKEYRSEKTTTLQQEKSIICS